ncbi:MAG TPA: NGG1p interacting factor NIF3 [Thermoleophilia bacterium]|nr:NGG1p interacting factor NIF3 [Thermoleophilia bacterium]
MYETAVRMGIDADPRGRARVDQSLELARSRYEKLPDYLKDVFDQEELSNPYVDTRIYVGADDAEVSALIAGIDMNVGEVLLADRLREKGRVIDAIYTHHPEGMALTKLDKVMDMQAEIWETVGVPITFGEAVMDERRVEVRRRFMPMNADQAIDAARLLDIPFFSAHTPTDNLVTTYLQRFLDERAPLLVDDVRRALFDVPEYRAAATKGAGPYIVEEKAGKRAGQIYVDMTGGTEGPVPVMEKLADHGVGTIVGMHMSPDLRKAAEDNHIHVVIAGHISSDSVGVNLLMDEYERRGVEIVPTSGYIRVRRDADWKLVD